MAEPQVLLEGLGFPEGPRWHGDRLWFAEFRDRTVCRVTLDGTRDVVAQLSDDTPSGLGFLGDSTPIVGSMRTKRLPRIVDGTTELHADLGHVVGDFLNDMVVDADGNAYVGTRTRAMRASRLPLPARFAVD